MPRYGTPNIGLHDVILLTNFPLYFSHLAALIPRRILLAGSFNSRRVKSQGVFIFFIGNVITVCGSDVNG